MAGWDERIAQLEAEFPGWHIWRSSAGRWWATRTGTVPRREDMGTGRVMTAGCGRREHTHNEFAVQASLDREITGLTRTPVPFQGQRSHPERGLRGHLKISPRRILASP